MQSVQSWQEQAKGCLFEHLESVWTLLGSSVAKLSWLRARLDVSLRARTYGRNYKLLIGEVIAIESWYARVYNTPWNDRKRQVQVPRPLFQHAPRWECGFPIIPKKWQYILEKVPWTDHRHFHGFRHESGHDVHGSINGPSWEWNHKSIEPGLDYQDTLPIDLSESKAFSRL